MKGIEGSTLGRYELHRRVAQGGMSEVYLGYDRRVRRSVAVKVLYGRDELFVHRFEREAVAVGALSHEHILPLYDFGEQRPWYYLVMPFVEGGTLRDYLFKREQLALEEAGSFLDQIASALQYAHDHGVVHRDVKPSNILLRPDGHAYLVDFGLAKAKMEVESLIHSGVMVGTPEYMAPELSDGQNDYRSDIYSLGIILYQMLTGHVPFMAESPIAVTLKHIQTPPISPRFYNKDIPESIEEVVLKALAKKPDERYQDARTFSSAYKKALLQEFVNKQGLEFPLSNTDEVVERVTTSALEIDITPSTSIQITPLFEIPSTSPRLFSRKRETLPVAPAPWFAGNKKRLPLILAGLLCFILLSASILFSFTGPPHDNSSSRGGTAHPPLKLATQRAATMTAQVRQTTTQANAQATLAAQARIQATAGITSAVGAGTLLYYNGMTSPGGGWIDDGTQCYFTAQGYHVSTSLAHSVAWCYNNQQIFANAIITAQIQLLRGGLGGVIFRLNPASKAFYVLEINGLGEYRLQRALGSDFSTWLTLIDWTYSNAIWSGYGSINTFLIVTNGPYFRFYINQQLIVSTFADSTYASGMIGFLVGGDTSGGTEAVFRHLAIFQR